MPDGEIVDLEGEDAAPSGQDRRRAVALVFALCLALTSAFAGRDKPQALAPAEAITGVALVEPPRHILSSLPSQVVQRVSLMGPLPTIGPTYGYPSEQWIRTTMVFSRGGKFVGWLTPSGVEYLDISNIPE
jgi:hypothetical protein